MKKQYAFLFALAFLFTSVLHVRAQITCNSAGNLWVYANYDGGVLNINCNVNIPNIKIGVCTYEPVTINISGTYVGNVTEVRYAGYVSTNNFHCSNSPSTTTITGVPAGITSVNFLPASTLSNPNGYGSIVCAYSCTTTTSQGGCNTADQIKSYFQTTTGGTLVSYFTQYGCWSTTPYLLGNGGNCCNSVPTCFIAANAGADQQVCAGGSVTLNGSATGGATVYSWSPTVGLGNPNSATTTASPTITTTYVLSAGDGASCSSTDTVVVTVNPRPVVNLGADTSLCGGSLVLNAGPQPNSTFLWSNSTTAQTLNISSSGTYSVTVTNTATGCTNSDAIVVTVNSVPTVNLGSDTSICGDMLVLNAGNPGMSYLWSNSTTAQTLTVVASGTYSVTVADANGCTATDMISIVFHQIPVVTFNAAIPVMCLADQPLALTTGSPAGGTYSGTGVVSGSFDPQVAGIGSHLVTYTFTDSVGCTSFATDSIVVDACLGTNSMALLAVRVFPNPSNGNFQLVVSHTCKAELANSLGQIVETKMLQPGTNSMGDAKLAEGVYTLRLTDGQQQEKTMRIVIQR